MTDESNVIDVRGLVHEYGTGSANVRVLDDVALIVERGDYVALVGPSGAGKTTLLSIIGGLERAQHGVVRVDGHDLQHIDSDGLASFRRSTVGFVFQHFGLLDALTASENVELAMTLGRSERRARRHRALELLDGVGLRARAHHRPGQLSGGERQRVAIARALANQPRLLLADEPTGNLDEAGARGVIELLEQHAREDAMTLVVVTHNPMLAGRAHRRVALVDGRTAAAARP
jgi:putative ABC transport system ATP-binding protein